MRRRHRCCHTNDEQLRNLSVYQLDTVTAHFVTLPFILFHFHSFVVLLLLCGYYSS